MHSDWTKTFSDDTELIRLVRSIFVKKSYIIENCNTQNLGARELTLNPYFSTYEKLKNTYKTE